VLTDLLCLLNTANDNNSYIYIYGEQQNALNSSQNMTSWFSKYEKHPSEL